MATATPKMTLMRNCIERYRLTRSGGVFQHLSGHGHMASAHQADESIAQVLAPDQEEDHQNDDDAGRGQHLQQCAKRSTNDLQWARRRGKHAN